MAGTHHTMFARIYDLLMIPGDRLGMARQRSRLCRPAEGLVLEVGVGTGLNLPHYQRAERVVGIDRDAAMLRRAGRRRAAALIPVDLTVADALALPFASGTFDTVVVGLALCTIPTPAAALAEMRRVASDEATLHFLEHIRSPKPRTARFQDRIAPLWGRVTGGCRLNQDTTAILDGSGWTVTDRWASKSGGLIQGQARPG